ncbi:hypothetical protein Bca101_095225 [Brassica carinata]
MATYNLYRRPERSEQTIGECRHVVLEKFVTIKDSSPSNEEEDEEFDYEHGTHDPDNDSEDKNMKSDWLKSVQLWNQPEPILPKEGLELNGSDAEIRKSSIRRISVEGYDTSLRMEDVDDALREHLASCGKIIHVSIPRNYEETILCRLKVTGYDTSLPVEDIEIELEKYFSSHGSFVYQDETASGAIKTKAYIYVRGPDAVDKALELSGRSVEGLNFVVTKVYPLPENPPMSGFIHPTEEECTSEGNQKKKKKNKKSKTREGIQKKKKSETREGKQKKGVEISL